jgi:hypothetical protein
MQAAKDISALERHDSIEALRIEDRFFSVAPFQQFLCGLDSIQKYSINGTTNSDPRSGGIFK